MNPNEEMNFEDQGNEYPVNPAHVALAMAYVNRAYIADQVLPRLAPAGARKFTYHRFDLSEPFTPSETEVGKFGSVGESRPKSEEVTDRVRNFGHSEPVSNEDIADNAIPGGDPLSRATLRVRNTVMLGRELRVSGLVFNPATYPSARKTLLSGTSQFSHASADPIVQLREYLDSMPMRATKAVMGQTVWNKVCTHPKVVSAALGNSGQHGVASRQRVAELLELDEIIVGRSLVNSSVKGQTPVISPAWGKHVALLYADQNADNTGGLTFGFTYQFGGPVVKTIGKPEMGLHGAQKQLVGESVREVISAPDCGFFIQNAVA